MISTALDEASGVGPNYGYLTPVAGGGQAFDYQLFPPTGIDWNRNGFIDSVPVAAPVRWGTSTNCETFRMHYHPNLMEAKGDEMVGLADVDDVLTVVVWSRTDNFLYRSTFGHTLVACDDGHDDDDCCSTKVETISQPCGSWGLKWTRFFGQRAK